MNLTLKGKVAGKGLYTRVYREGDAREVTIVSTCRAKEIMALGWLPESKFYPDIKRTDHQMVYAMSYYPKVRSLKKALKPAHWLIYQQLRKFYKQLLIPSHPDKRIFALRKAITEYQGDLSDEMRELLQDSLDGLVNYGTDVWIEIMPRNVAADSEGNLILLDIWFYVSSPEYSIKIIRDHN